MIGLCLERRADLAREINSRALASERHPGSRQLVLTVCDARVYKSLALTFHNGRTGRTDPGCRALAKDARVGLGTVPTSSRRLRDAGYIDWKRRFVRISAGVRRWTHSYILLAKPRPRSGFGEKPRIPNYPRNSLAAARARSIAWWKAEQAREASKPASLLRTPAPSGIRPMLPR